jgi:iron complex outermembrane receptor protein
MYTKSLIAAAAAATFRQSAHSKQSDAARYSTGRAPLRSAMFAVAAFSVAATPHARADATTQSAQNTPASGPAAPEVALPPITVNAAPSPTYGAETSLSTTRTNTPLKDYPASIQVVPSEVLQDRGVTRIDQLADNVSGIHAEASYGGNGATFFNIRGFGESNGLRDGFRNYGYYAFRDVQSIDRIEVFKGPAGALYGGIGAVGGYINTISKHPERTNFGEVGVTAGTDGLARTTLDLNRVVNDDLSVRLNASAATDSTFRDNAGSRSWSIAPAITWDNHHGTSVTLLRDGFKKTLRGC